MMTQVDAVKQRNEELKDRAERDIIVHETVPGEDKILTENDKRNLKDKAAKSTTDEDTN
ncbi:MAG: hypothetical protein Q7T66_17645 [Herminiimonas sp.]|uniref:hypothetical protein n=1 Tax=Herminiimonas sp. TaxID=1926289 RepID=UPI0027159FCA|nr:hypothetical protein [Herminiimonas sp.]MDO9422488.1 hypothetical protein [Herminiimonas sp.]